MLDIIGNILFDSIWLIPLFIGYIVIRYVDKRIFIKFIVWLFVSAIFMILQLGIAFLIAFRNGMGPT
jgi:hypothetical protein